jgi:predicted transcriptional regulator
MKTMAIRLEDELHAQLSMLAKLEEVSVADAIRQSIEGWVNERRSRPELVERAQQVLGDIDREMSVRRGAIEALLAPKAPSGAAKGRGSRPRPDAA